MKFIIAFISALVSSCALSLPQPKDVEPTNVVREPRNQTSLGQNDLIPVPGQEGEEITRAERSTFCSCGSRHSHTRIVGGTHAQKNEFPWRCALYSRGKGAFCGATVIDNEWVMTAAHCTAALKRGEKLLVDCGDHDLRTTKESKNQVREVDYHRTHPRYSTKNQDNDISLLHLSKPLNFGTEVSAVCLPWKQQGNQCKNSGTKVWASGWGVTKYGGSPSMILKRVEMLCMSSQTCTKYYGKAITNNMVCTLSKGEDTCQGDSGGSIDYRDPRDNRYYALGVVSWGEECAKANKPGVYTNVVNYLDWIKSTTRKSFCGQ